MSNFFHQPWWWAQYTDSSFPWYSWTCLCVDRSPAKNIASSAGSSSRWSQQEKELFEEGLVCLHCKLTFVKCNFCLGRSAFNGFNNCFKWVRLCVLSKLPRCVVLQARFGRRWTKIAKLMESRTVLQVKSYARQYFKHKVRQSTWIILTAQDRFLLCKLSCSHLQI